LVEDPKAESKGRSDVPIPKRIALDLLAGPTLEGAGACSVESSEEDSRADGGGCRLDDWREYFAGAEEEGHAPEPSGIWLTCGAHNITRVQILPRGLAGYGAGKRRV